MAEPAQEAALRDARLEDLDGLGEALDWQPRGWPAWSEYQPIAEQALIHGLSMHPGKPSHDLVREVSRGQPPPPELAARLDLERPYPPEMEAALLEDLDESHCGRLPQAALAPMARVQRLWDAWMADALLRAGAARDGAVLIAGAGHVRRDRAVPWHLHRRSAAEGEVLALALVEVTAGIEDATAYSAFDAGLFDYVWFTPRVDEQDPCAALDGAAAQ
jgi:uncharacterized iron-regulated protein